MSPFAVIARGVAELIYPNACLVCDAPEAGASPFWHGLCMECQRAVIADPRDTCPRCAATVGPHSDASDGCVSCRSRSFAFTHAGRLGPYEGRLKDAILRMKSAPGEALAEMFGRVLADERGSRLREAGIEVVVPIPLHWRRRWSRSYNQAEAIARELAAALGAEFRPGWLRRVKHPPQHGQPSAAAREENIRGAFRCANRARFADRAVLLVDDVMTTGSTMGEAARMVRAAGASRIVAAVLARA